MQVFLRQRLAFIYRVVDSEMLEEDTFTSRLKEVMDRYAQQAVVLAISLMVEFAMTLSYVPSTPTLIVGFGPSAWMIVMCCLDTGAVVFGFVEKALGSGMSSRYDRWTNWLTCLLLYSWVGWYVIGMVSFGVLMAQDKEPFEDLYFVCFSLMGRTMLFFCIAFVFHHMQ